MGRKHDLLDALLPGAGRSSGRKSPTMALVAGLLIVLFAGLLIVAASPAFSAQKGPPTVHQATPPAQQRSQTSQTSETSQLADALRRLPADVLPPETRAAARMIPDNLDERLHRANRRSSAAWNAVGSRQEWERFRDEKLRLLCRAIGPQAESPPELNLHITGKLKGPGYRIRKLVFQSRPGLWITANLYEPAEARGPMPGLLICHSHHAPKEHAELQEMGMMWARAGCLVLVPDMLGHGERRQHPFATETDYHQPFRVGRQDYYFRYDVGMQLHLAGETLMGWFVWDLRRSVSVLLSRPGVDPQRIVILGAVAGGGDPAAVAAALDGRIQGAVVFNFGGAEPESPYPLPEDAEQVFNYAERGSFESTRNLRRSAADGFLPWVIVGAIAPRRLVYAHEFAWDRARDPVWKRLQTIWEFYDAQDRLAAIHGRGSVRGRPPESTHCTHIGRVHRASLHPILERWFHISVSDGNQGPAAPGEALRTCKGISFRGFASLQPRPPGSGHRIRETIRLQVFSVCTEAALPVANAPAETEEYWDVETLRSMTPEWAERLKPKRLCDLLPHMAAERLAAARHERQRLAQPACRDRLRRQLASVLGPVAPRSARIVRAAGQQRLPIGRAHVERVVLEVEPGIVVPLVLLLPEPSQEKRRPVVVAVAQAGKGELLEHRAEMVAELLVGGAAVCLPDLRGLGETKPEGSRERWGAMVGHSSTELMLGSTMVGARLRDLRSVLACLRTREDLDPRRIALWGDSLAAANPPDRNFLVPRHMDDRPQRSEPLGGLLALLGALYEDDVCAVYICGGLSDVRSVLAHQMVCIPHDVVVPGLLRSADLPDLAAAVAPRPLRMDGLVDGLNRRCDTARVRQLYEPAARSYERTGAGERLVIHSAGPGPARWLLQQLGSL